MYDRLVSHYRLATAAGCWIKGALALLLLCLTLGLAKAEEAPDFSDESAEVVATPYAAQKVLFDFYFDDPQYINSALFWVRSLLNPLMAAPYSYAPEDIDIKVVIHGTEIVALAKKNYDKYREAVERMRYYADFGVEFRVCGLAASDYGYSTDDFYDFVQLVPSAMPELAHWQMQGYALIIPQMLIRRHSIEEIR